MTASFSLSHANNQKEKQNYAAKGLSWEQSSWVTPSQTQPSACLSRDGSKAMGCLLSDLYLVVAQQISGPSS